MFNSSSISIGHHQHSFIGSPASNITTKNTENSFSSPVLLDVREYSRFFESLSIARKPLWSRSFGSTPPSFGLVFGTQKFDLSTIEADDLIKLVRDSRGGNRLLQEQMTTDKNIRERIMDLVTKEDGSLLFQLAIDESGNFVIQKLIDMSEYHPNSKMVLFSRIEALAFDMACNRYACRVIQKYITKLSEHQLQAILDGKQFRDNAALLATDQNGSHLIHNIVEFTRPEVYVHFFTALSKNSPGGLNSVMENKYGCRLIQFTLEHIVRICDHTLIEGDNKSAFDVLHLIMVPILKDARQLAQNEYANYVVQSVLKMDFLHRQRHYIICNHLLHHVLSLSQSKYSSHVMEQAIAHADDQCLEAIFMEILDGYEINEDGTTALDQLLFNQFGNYVAQRMLKIAIDVYTGKRHKGDPLWFHQIATAVYKNIALLQRYSSGKKILGAIEKSGMRFAPQQHISTVRTPLRLVDVSPQPQFYLQPPPPVRINLCNAIGAHFWQ